MRILSVVRKNYYGAPNSIEPMHAYFTQPLQEMGHEVETFDHFEMARQHGRERSSQALVDRIRRGKFEVVLYQTSGQEPIDTSRLADLSRSVCIVAWNSDDDWQWEITRRISGHFTFMVTTYPQIYDANRSSYPNLLLSQWACPTDLDGFQVRKDIPFSFAGSIYADRNEDCRYLRRKLGLACFGRGARLVRMGLPYSPGFLKLSLLAGPAIEFSEVRSIWNRTKVSYTPLKSSAGAQFVQVKGRIFEMGLSGTLVLCEYTPLLERYYQPGREIVAFHSTEDCAEKARWYLAHETERTRIALNYRNRTMKDHLWTHRFKDLFVQIGI